MKPELLILEGVYSYKHRTEIDFSTLCEADLFGIFGNVGSGKSAILEAVTYVLYGKIERLSNRVYYNMMNLASNRMYIDFTFSNKGRKYRFTFETRRNKKDFEKIETPLRSAYVMEAGEWLPLFDKDGEVSADEIIGLNYENFRRTIIVPQGRFQEFLHLGKRDRTDMLMELFSLKRFDLYSKTAHLANRNNEQTASVEGELSGLSDASIEALSEAEKELAAAEKQAVIIADKIKSNDVLLKKQGDLAELDKQLSAARLNQAVKADAEAGFTLRKSELNEFEDCFSKFKSELDILNVLKLDIESEQKKLKEVKSRLETDKLKLEEAEQKYNAIEGDYSKLALMEKQADWYIQLAEIRNAAEESANLRSRIESGRSALEDLVSAKQQAADRLRECMAVLEADNKGIEVETVNTLNALYRALSDVRKMIDTTEGRLKELKTELSSAEVLLEDYNSLEEEEAALLEREKSMHSRQMEAEIDKSIGRLAGKLKDGEACPLCGSLEHPSPSSASVEDEDIFAAESEEISKKRKLLKLKTNELQALKNKEAGLQGRIQDAADQLDKLQADELEIIAGFPEGDFGPDDRPAFEKEAQRQSELRSQREKIQKESTDLSREQERLNGEISRITGAESVLKLELAGIEARIESVEDRIEPGFLDDNRDAAGSELLELGKAAELRIAAVRDGFKEAEQNKKNASAQFERDITEAEVLQTRITELENACVSTEKKLEKAASESKYSDIKTISEILSMDIDAAAERAEIDTFEKELAAVKAEIESLNNRMGGEVFEQKVYAEAEAKNIELSEAYNKMIGRMGELSNIISGLESRILRKKVLEKEAEALRVRSENLAVLKNIFKGKKFIDYAATIYLRELCEAANIRFRKLTRESLRLELDEGNNFIIRDYLNEGRTRSVKTLSGGQTFQAAFSLSLALADSIGRERSGFFFLDEGFGSLDRDSLSLVFESLKSLKKEERTVGIISHVEELKQEIDTFIAVRKDDEEGSMIKNSWN